MSASILNETAFVRPRGDPVSQPHLADPSDQAACGQNSDRGISAVSQD
jgi:hypothetical protein